MRQELVGKIEARGVARGWFAAGKRLLIGVSGGADSVCLLHVLAQIAAQRGMSLFAVHVHHGLRDEEADRDAAFSLRLCESLGVPAELVRVPVREYAKEHGIGAEEAGRSLRYACFLERAKAVGADAICVAHHLDDQAETVLFRMARGTGIRGLAAMAEETELADGKVLLRPLLTCKKEELLQYLGEQQLTYVEDSSNSELQYKRNLLRHKVLPELTEVNARAAEHIAELALQAAEWAEYMKQQATRCYCQACRDGVLMVEVLLTEAAALRREVVAMWLHEQLGEAVNLSRGHIHAAEQLLWGRPGASTQIRTGLVITRCEEGLVVDGNHRAKSPDGAAQTAKVSACTKKPVIRQLSLPALGETVELALGNGGTLRLRHFLYEKEMKIPKKLYTKWFDYDKIPPGVAVRTRCAGDYLVIDTAGSRKLLQNYFVDARISANRRELVPLLAAGQHIIWVIGYRNSEAFRVEDQTREILEAEWI